MTALRRRVTVASPAVDLPVLLIPVGLACAYLVLLLVRLPTIVGWLNTDGDVTSAWMVASAVAHGHPGEVVMMDQPAWVPLAFGALTHGLSFHRVLWELSPIALTVAFASLVGWSVARVCTRTAGILATLLILAASPTALLVFTAPWWHNTTLAGVAVLAAFLVWVPTTRQASRIIFVAAVATGAVIGTLVASDAMLLFDGVLPFVIAPALIAWRTRDRTMVVPVLIVAIVAAIVAVAVGDVAHALGAIATPPPLLIGVGMIPQRLVWIVGGLLRLGNGLGTTRQPPIRLVFTVAAGAATVAGIAATLRAGARAVGRSGDGRSGDGHAQARSVSAAFWAAAVVCSIVTYLLTVQVESDRYLIIAVPAVIATIAPLWESSRLRRRVAAGSVAFLAAGLVALACGDWALPIRRQVEPAQANRIQAVVQRQHLGVGYAGYWDAAPLDWASRLRLHIYPVVVIAHQLEPMNFSRVNAWYRPRRTPSFLLLEPHDSDLADRLPPGLPRPQRIIHVGSATIAVYPFDIAADLHPPID